MVVFQSSTTQKTSNPLRFLVWICPLTLSSLSYLISVLRWKYPLTRLCLTRRLLHPYRRLVNLLYNPDVAPSASIGSPFSVSSPKASQSENTRKLPPFSSFFSEVRPLLSRPNRLKLQRDHSALGQHLREYYTNHTRRTKRRRFNQHLQYCHKPEFCKREIIFWDSKRQEYTIQSTSLPSQRLAVPPQAITALPCWCRLTLLHQLSSLIINLPLTHLFRCATLLQWVSPWLN